MTRQEAIERLEICQNVCDDCLTCASHDDALDMAIAALREQGNCCKNGNSSKTNADHIRSMTDEELARFHLLECPCMAEVYGECKYGWHDREQTCEECMLEWLKQPYKEENT